MNPKLYDHIVSLIEEYRTWIKVTNKCYYIRRFVLQDGLMIECNSKALALESYKVRWGYTRSRRWYITMPELAKGVNYLTAVDKNAKSRVDARQLTLYDVETIVEIATNGLLKLGLGRHGFG